MVTTPLAIRSSVCAQLAGDAGMPGADTGAGSGWAAANARVTDNTKTDRNNAVRDMPILVIMCQCPWSDKMRSHTVPNNTELSITAANPMSVAMPASGWRSAPAPPPQVENSTHQYQRDRAHEEGSSDARAAEMQARGYNNERQRPPLGKCRF